MNEHKTPTTLPNLALIPACISDIVSPIINELSGSIDNFSHIFKRGYSGVDIGPLRDGKICLLGLVPDSQRYFDFHHAPTDTFENVNQRELELGAAALTSIIYLIDKYGFPEEGTN